MAAPGPRKRKSALPPMEKTVKTSITMGASLHLQLAAAAAIEGIDRNALTVRILTEALRGIVVMDRRKVSGRSGAMDRQVLEDELKDPAENEAA